MRGLSIKHPWAWAIVHAGKCVENRDWYCDHRGPVFIHASKLRLSSQGSVPSDFIAEWKVLKRILDDLGVKLADLPQVSYRSLVAQSGGIIGRAKIVDCILPGGLTVGTKEPHPLSMSPWYEGSYGFVLEDVSPVPFVAYEGSPGLWSVTNRVCETIERLARNAAPRKGGADV